MKSTTLTFPEDKPLTDEQVAGIAQANAERSRLVKEVIAKFSKSELIEIGKAKSKKK